MIKTFFPKFMEHLECAFCDGKTETKHITKTLKRDGKEYKLQMNAEVCPNCSEEYYDGKTLMVFERAVKNQTFDF